MDYKTSDAKDEHAAFYSRQLYANALENPAPKALCLSHVSHLGLFMVTPDHFERSTGDEMVFVNCTTWVAVPRDDVAFLSLIGEVLAVLDTPTAPEPSDGCPLCQYRRIMQALG